MNWTVLSYLREVGLCMVGVGGLGVIGSSQWGGSIKLALADIMLKYVPIALYILSS